MKDASKKFQLSNGLTVIYEKNTNADVVALNMGIRVGSVHETDAESGICHLIEHMVFKGTKSYAAGEIATLVEAHGGELNAYTSLDQTVYYINLPNQHLGLGLSLLKEMVFDAKFDSVELEREKEVVVEEIRRGADSPQRVLSEFLFQSFFRKHNYRRPVIGTEKHVRSFSRKKIFEFYKTHYVPQDMILGVCGNVEESILNQYLEDLFASEKSMPREHFNLPKESAKRSLTIKSKSMDVQATYFDLAFHAPQVDHADVAALDTLSHFLGEGGASLLEQNTKEKAQLVNYIYSGCYTPRYAGVFVIGGQAESKNINAAFQSIVAQIHFVRDELVSLEELERVKLLARSQMIYDKQTCEGTVKKWMNYETTIGNYRYDQEYIEVIIKLTPQDIQRVANKYLDLNQATVVILHPVNQKPKLDRGIFRKTKTKPKTFSLVQKKKGVGLYRLKNGLRVIVKENHRLELFSLKLVSEGGLRYESKHNNGWSNLMANTLAKGSAQYSQRDIAEKCESLAAHFATYAGRNSWGGSFTGLSEKFNESLEFVADLFLHPNFDEAEIQKEKRLQIQAIQNREDSPAQLAFYHNFQKLFKGHPYAMSTLGDLKSLQQVSHGKLMRYYENFFVPENLVLSVVGAVETQSTLEKIENTFGQLSKKNFKKKKIKSPQLPPKTKHIFVPKEKNQTHLVVGFLGASLHSKDRYALEVLNHIFSGQGGRLFLELRDKQSLAYSISSMMIEGLETGFFGVYMGTEPQKIQKALDGIFLELEKVQSQKVSRAELARAKNYIIGNFAIDHQKNGDVAMQLALNELYGKSIDDYFDFSKAVRKVTLDDVQRVAQKYLRLNRALITVVGPHSPF